MQDKTILKPGEKYQVSLSNVMTEMPGVILIIMVEMAGKKRAVAVVSTN